MKENEAVLAGQRAEIYHFLAGLFLKPPSRDLLELACSGDPAQFFPAGDKDSPWVGEIAHFAKEYAASDNLMSEIEAEHTTLFILPSGVIPHEAAYTDGNKRLGGAVTLSVAGFYASAAIEVNTECVEMPDHLGMELEFLARLCTLEKRFREQNDADSLAQCLSVQHDFMSRHIGCWVHQCCEAVVKNARTGFFRALALFTSDFLREEEECIKEVFVKTSEEEEVCENVET